MISYLFASICVILVTKLYLNKDASLISLVTGIFNFKTDKYAWYIEMYIGLFLLIPFLNVLWHGLDKKNKKILILSLILLTSISPILKSFSLDIVPDWWQGFYPITYYFIGAYIKEYPIKISKIKNILLILLLLVIQTSLFYYLNYSRLFDWQIFGTYGNLFTLLISTLIFILFYDINFKKEKIKIIFKDISILSLDIFLLSYITDNIVYDVLKNLFDYKTLSLMFIIIVPLLFIFNYLLAHIEKLILKFLSYLKNKIKNYFVRRDEVCNHS